MCVRVYCLSVVREKATADIIGVYTTHYRNIAWQWKHVFAIFSYTAICLVQINNFVYQ